MNQDEIDFAIQMQKRKVAISDSLVLSEGAQLKIAHYLNEFGPDSDLESVGLKLFEVIRQLKGMKQ